jgi:HAD superfamily hydrolase (TIGR01549 family)
MAVEAITFDLWGTVLWPRDPDGKLERRMALLLEVLEIGGVRVSREVLQEAWHASFAEADALIRRDFVDIGPAGRWRVLTGRLGVPEGRVPFERVEQIYQELTLKYPPALMPGVEDALRSVAGRYRVGLICNTGVTGGAVLRRVLAHHGVLECFDATVFSNEFGRVKPDPSIFHHTLGLLGGVLPGRALHVGDLEELDIDGARSTGMLSLRYVSPELYETPVESQAERVFHDWAEFPALLEGLPPRPASPPDGLPVA